MVEKTQFSWARLAEERLRETEAAKGREPKPVEAAVELPLAPPPAAEPAAWESDWARDERPPEPTTRHDAEHGSVAARSVLDRLGISGAGGQGGGRRRAPDEPEAAEPWQRDEDLAPPPRVEDTREAPLSAYSDEAADPWLPRLRMPPSLEPLDDFGGWTPSTAPFPESYARAIAEDEPPPDAGLADLLARALAEHQAGTASAAALVKQLGTEDRRQTNGHRRNGSDPEHAD